MSKAEADFRCAFNRLKAGEPINVPVGTPVTQNNVAREAGRDPSALKKARYPQLIKDIQDFISSRSLDAKADLDGLLPTSSDYQQLVEQLEALTLERDMLLSKLFAANERILILNAHVGHES